MQPTYIIFAGINGAGKTTLFKSKMWETANIPEMLYRVNPDEIVKENKLDSSSDSDQLLAGKIAVKEIKSHFENTESFTHETVFAGKTSLKRIDEAKQHGFRVILNYVGLKDCQLAIDRIAHRVKVGGHDISSNLVLKRWSSSLENLNRAREMCDEVHVFDNTELLKEIAVWNNGTLCWWGATSLRGGWLADALLSAPSASTDKSQARINCTLRGSLKNCANISLITEEKNDWKKAVCDN